MAIPKWIELYKDKALSGDSGTETFPIKRTDQILQLLLKVRAKNGATANAPDAAAMPTVESALTKINVKSGSADFKSYSGEICRKLAAYRNGRVPKTLYTQAAGGAWAGNDDPSLGWQEYAFPIYFNTPRDPYGNLMALPAPLYDSLDLVMDYNFTISATAGFVTGGSNHIFDLYALVMPKQDNVSMQNKRILVETKKQDYTSKASGDEPLNLTLDANRYLRQLMVFCYENGIGEGVDITELKLKVDGDTFWASKWGALQAQNAEDASWDGIAIPNMYLKCQTATDELWTRVPAPYPYMIAGTGPTIAPYFTALGNGDKVTITTDAANDVNLIDIRSPVIPAVAVIDLDKDGSLQNMQWCGAKDLDVILTNGGADAAVQIIEQHVAKPWGYSQ